MRWSLPRGHRPCRRFFVPLGSEADAQVAEVAQTATAVAHRFDDAYWAEHCVAGKEPTELWQELASADLLGIGLPEAYGGVGGGVTESAALVETLAELGRPLFSLITTHICREVLLRHGTAEQRTRYLPDVAAGRLGVAFAITEPDAGTNTFAIRTSATVQAEGSLLLSGHKC